MYLSVPSIKKEDSDIQMITFIHNHEALFFWITIASIIGFIGSLVLIPWIAIQIPSDYFSHKKRQKYQWHNYPPIVRLVFILLKNILGVIFIIGGVVMLILPGQGILTIILGLLFTDFPYKYKVESWIIKHPVVLRSVNHLRVKVKRSPLEV